MTYIAPGLKKNQGAYFILYAYCIVRFYHTMLC